MRNSTIITTDSYLTIQPQLNDLFLSGAVNDRTFTRLLQIISKVVPNTGIVLETFDHIRMEKDLFHTYLLPGQLTTEFSLAVASEKSVLHHFARNLVPVICRTDELPNERLFESLRQLDNPSMLVVPLLFGELSYSGSLIYLLDTDMTLSAEDVSVLSNLSQMISLYISHFRQKTMIDNYQSNFQIIGELIGVINESPDLATVFDYVTGELCARLGVEQAAIFLLSENGNMLECKAVNDSNRSHHMDIDQAPSIPLGEGIIGSVAQSGIAEIIPDASIDPRHIRAKYFRFSEIAVPILLDRHVIGVIDCAHSDKNYFGGVDQRMLTSIAAIIANKIRRERTEAQIEESTNSLQNLFMHSSIGLWDEDYADVINLLEAKAKRVKNIRETIRKNTKFVQTCLETVNVLAVNPAAVRIFGAESADQLREKYGETYTPEALNAFRDILIGILDNQNEFQTRIRRRRFDGEDVHILYSVNFGDLRRNQGRIIVNMADITDQVRIDEKLKSSENMITESFNVAPVSYLYIDLKTAKIQYFNDKALSLFGYPASQLAGKTVAELIHPDDLEVVQLMRKVNLKGKNTENQNVRIRTRSGSEIQTIIHSSPVHDAAGEVIASRTFLLELKGMEVVDRQLNEQRVLYETIFNTLPVDFIILNPDFTYQYVSSRAVKDDEIREWMIGRTNFEYAQRLEYDHEIAERRQFYFNKVCEFHKPITWQEEIPNDDGEPVIFSRQYFPMFIDDELKYIIGTGYEVTDKATTERMIREQKERLESILDALGESVITTDRDGKIQAMNHMAADLLTVQPAKIHGEPIESLIKLRKIDSDTDITNPVVDLLENGEHQTNYDDLKWVLQNGEIDVIYSVTPLYDGMGELDGAVLILTDISEKRQLNTELEKTQKLESIGRLAGGIAHDFNNILASIVGHIEFLRMHIDSKDTDLIDHIENIDVSANRAQQLTTHLLTFSSGGDPVRRALKLPEYVKEQVEFALRGTSVRTDFSIEENIPPVLVDESQISQVISNVVINAVDAMPSGGTLRISIRCLSVAQHIHLEDGKYVVMTFSDEGIGMPKEMISKIFDPFFTTKENKRGLGLSTVFSIIKRHGGLVDVKSQFNKGTAMIIYLPVMKIESNEPVQMHHQGGNGNNTIVIMDDDAQIRGIVEKALQHHGYDTVITQSGNEVLELVKKSPDLDKFILDLTVPGDMGGKEALAELKKMNPDIRAIAASGYSNDPVMSNHRAFGFSGSISKPFRLKQFIKLVEDVFGKPDASR